MVRKTITVTEDDIKNGRRDQLRGPISLAMSRAFGKPCSAYVSRGNGNWRTWMHDDVWSRDIRDLPAKAVTFAERFDKREPVEPFSFTVAFKSQKVYQRWAKDAGCRVY